MDERMDAVCRNEDRIPNTRSERAAIDGVCVTALYNVIQLIIGMCMRIIRIPLIHLCQY
ncbi:MAG: hypothetical protein MJA31_19035 [Clostridia bacterium]|nr:hypothetical protein [Clostridia bacterium]